MGNSDKPLALWLASSDNNTIGLWREAFSQLRQLHNDIWNGVRFFLSVNGLILVIIITLTRNDGVLKSKLMIIGLCIVGSVLTMVARKILKHHRKSYLKMLTKKILIEWHLGFFEVDLAKENLSFPWSIDPESIKDLMGNPENWINSRIRSKGTISRLLFLAYEWTIVLYALIIIGSAISLL